MISLFILHLSIIASHQYHGNGSLLSALQSSHSLNATSSYSKSSKVQLPLAMTSNPSTTTSASTQLPTSKPWTCVENCGACCYLGGDDRGAEDILDEEDLLSFMGMIGEDGWCMHFDKNARKCRVYDQRPRFCRVEADVFNELYGVEKEELDEFAKECCVDHIEGVFGKESREMDRFIQKTS